MGRSAAFPSWIVPPTRPPAAPVFLAGAMYYIILYRSIENEKPRLQRLKHAANIENVKTVMVIRDRAMVH